MFEQSLLADGPVARKSGAFAVSLTAQVLMIGGALLVPLIYNDVLPMVRLADPKLVLAVSAPPAPPVQSQPEQASSSRLHVARETRVYTGPPRNVPTRPAAQDIGGYEGPPVVGLGDGQPSLLPSNMLTILQIAPPRNATVAQPTPTAAPTRLGGEVLAAKILKRVIPVYPRLAVQARVSGTVRLQGILSKDGTIQQLQVLSGHPLLVPAAVDAVRQWVYRPTLLNGEPVEVIAPIDVVFTLQN
jgi:periplasmic protein TonB